MDDNEQKIENEREYHYIYFNEFHDISKEIKISISSEYEGANTLEKFDGKNPYESAYNNNTSLKIYRFKIFTDLFQENKKGKTIKINLEQNEKQSEFIFNLENIDITKDYFEYDFGKNISEIDFIKTTYEQQLEIYDNFIVNTLKKKSDSKENEEFIYSSQRLISDKNSKYTLYFYMLIKMFKDKNASKTYTFV